MVKDVPYIVVIVITNIVTRTTNISPYYGMFVCGIQVCVLQMEVNQASGDQSV